MARLGPLALLIGSAPASAEITLPSPVPANLAQPLGAELQQRHDALVASHDRIDREIDTQNADCSAVSPDDQTLVSHCQAAQQQILGEMADYQKALDAYERALKQVPAASDIDDNSAKLDHACSELDAELDRMSKAELKIVAVEMDALGRLSLRVPVAVLIGGSYEASEPPEEVIDEARETLRRVADLTEQVDELNGKRAWQDQERAWVLDHIYVATPTGDFSVVGSDRTATGQTAFAELRGMPAFRGCATSGQGKKYIPQIEQ